MSNNNFSRRHRGMRFRPSGGLGHGQQHPEREASQARAEAVGGPPTPEKVYEHRHAHEIERSENIAAGLPPEGLPRETPLAPEVTVKNIGDLLMTQYVLPLEVIGLLLTAALIGAVIIAMRDETPKAKIEDGRLKMGKASEPSSILHYPSSSGGAP